MDKGAIDKPMTGPEQLFWAEIAAEDATRRSVAVCYALLIAIGAGRGPDFWVPINEAVNARFGWTVSANREEIDDFRKEAWFIHDAAATATRPEAAHG